MDRKIKKSFFHISLAIILVIIQISYSNTEPKEEKNKNKTTHISENKENVKRGLINNDIYYVHDSGNVYDLQPLLDKIRPPKKGKR